jgi:hypothetical protein
MAKYSTTATFVAGATATGTQTTAVTLNEKVLTGIVVSGSIITGSYITFLVSNDGTTFYPLYDSSNTEVTLIPTSASRAFNVNPENFLPWSFVKARLGTSASPKAQATYDTTIEFITRDSAVK